MSVPSVKIDLSSCAREPIHIPGAIQPRGVLLGFDASWKVTHAAAAPKQRFLAVGNPLGLSLDELFPEAASNAIRSHLLDCPRPGRNNHFTAELPGAGGPVRAAISLHRNQQGVVILEAEDAVPDSAAHVCVDNALAEVITAATEEAVLNAAVRSIKLLTGYARVMGYVFDRDYNGTVIAEIAEPDLASYLGDRFPASDIPEQARALYKRKRARLIADVAYQPVPITALPGIATPLDLSNADLRSVSPIHLEYLANMGVGGTLVCSLLRDGELLGMLACHHLSPKFVPPAIRDKAVLIADVAAARLATLRDTVTGTRTIAAYRENAELLYALTLDHGSVETLGKHVERLHRMIDASGAAVIIGDSVFTSGRTPTPADTRLLAAKFTGDTRTRVGHTNHLASVAPELARLNDVAAGVLAVPLHEHGTDAVLWFRPEVVASVAWAGNPNKPVEGGIDGDRVAPRKNFERYVELVHNRSEPWKPWETQVAESVRASVTNIASQLSQLSALAEQRRSAERAARKHAEQLSKASREMEAARDEAMVANRSKSEFLANMSHEIRTPMTAILGYADLLAGDGEHETPPQQRAEYAGTIRRNGEHLLAIISDILDISKIESGKMTVEAVPVAPITMVRDVLALMDVKAKAKSITLDACFDSAVPETIHSDPVRLRQILVNLVGNAIKFTETGGVRIAVSFDPDDRLLRLNVIDSGIGLTPEQMGRLFSAFVQADTSMTRRFGGTGLGLNISKRLAQMLGGDIEVCSERDGGSTFTTTVRTGDLTGVPMVEPAEALAALRNMHAVVAKTSTGEAHRPLAGVSILLAEDGLDNQRLISFHLRKAGAEVRTADNGKLAVEALTVDGTVDGELLSPAPVMLLISDMQMPELDGYESVRLLRSKGCTLPIIALTAHAMAGEREKCIDAGCDSYATKPIDKLKLIEACIATLANRCCNIAAV